jgi:hypothetical protein
MHPIIRLSHVCFKRSIASLCRIRSEAESKKKLKRRKKRRREKLQKKAEKVQ